MTRRTKRRNSTMRFWVRKSINLKDGSAKMLKMIPKFSTLRKKTLLPPKPLLKMNRQFKLIKLVQDSITEMVRKMTLFSSRTCQIKKLTISLQRWRWLTTSGTMKCGPLSTTRIPMATSWKAQSISSKETQSNPRSHQDATFQWLAHSIATRKVAKVARAETIDTVQWARARSAIIASNTPWTCESQRTQANAKIVR